MQSTWYRMAYRSPVDEDGVSHLVIVHDPKLDVTIIARLHAEDGETSWWTDGLATYRLTNPYWTWLPAHGEMRNE